MVAFYRSLGMEVTEAPLLIQVHVGSQMINFHRPELMLVGFRLRAPAATPPCGDICFVWEGSADELNRLLADAGAEIIEGPVERVGARGTAGSSVYIRDPDGNLLEFLTYPVREINRMITTDLGGRVRMATSLRRRFTRRGPHLPTMKGS